MTNNTERMIPPIRLTDHPSDSRDTMLDYQPKLITPADGVKVHFGNYERLADP